MGIDIHGWVEFKPDWYEAINPAHAQWVAVVNVGSGLLGRDRVIFEYLFGVFTRLGLQPIAAARGIPNDASEETERDYLRWAEDSHGAIHPTWISWLELRVADWHNLPPDIPRPGEDWQLLIKIMDALAGRYGEEKVRLVVWFDQ